MRVASRIDSNQTRMVSHLRQCGLVVILLHMVGKGVPDLLTVGYSRKSERVEALLVEVKTEKGKLTSDQVTWHGEWLEKFEDGGPLLVARESTDVLQWYGLI